MKKNGFAKYQSVHGFAPLIIILVIAILGVVGYFGYKNLRNTTNRIAKTERITLQEGYYFDVTIPKGFSLKKGVGDYVYYVVDSDGVDLIGFQKTWGGGELSPSGRVVIDNVSLTIDYIKDVGCPASIYSEKANNPQRMSFGITTWCKDKKETQLPVYKEVLESIVFGPKLKEVLLGKLSAPLLN